MGLLAPLYALAALAIVGPIVFHLIQRQPRGKMQFSSLMFLRPSPPRLTRRSRLDNWLLLLLRALAIGLIAFAFARPYLRQESFLNSTLPGRNILVLFDTSASMQREDVWTAAVKSLQELVDSLSPEDRIALYTVDESVVPVVPIDAEPATTAAMTVQAVKTAASELAPTWKKTRLAEGLRTVADLMNTAALTGKIDAGAEHEIVLISDLHAESSLESLQGFPWPESIRLDVRQIAPADVGNARASLMLADEETGADNIDSPIKLRVENNANSPQQTFQIMWANRTGPITESSTTVQVPAGQVRVLPVTPRPSGATRLVLSGDAWSGDNTVYVAETIRGMERIALIGADQPRDEENLGYFLKKAPLDTSLVRREVFDSSVEQLDLSDPQLEAVVIEPAGVDEGFAGRLRAFADAGGTVIVCLARNTETQQSTAFLNTLTGQTGIELSEADVDNFALLGAIDYRHPVFAPFADPRFNDFSKLRFWSHRVLRIESDASPLKAIASFDDRNPLLLEAPVGKGMIWVLTAGWQPSSSTLALSSKFIPILMGMLDPSGQSLAEQRSYEVGEAISTREFAQDVELFHEDGREVASTTAEFRNESVTLFEPGMYRMQAGEENRTFAVQVPASESQLLPLDTDIFEQYGIKLGKLAGDVERTEAMRQLQVEELEGKQRLWQWLIVGSIAVLGVETLLGGIFARRLRVPQTT